ncbi:protein NRT1/ PTR FAMILY 5.4-like [Herrania umbratica]|uniref:Protein NRT1/ PTR FAMILY 5.4-like n=1 Tax=Herrania umbratica TaxID=108875 RepID=A0A6J1BDK5_9ROSI|nr:protein NRT1/ PTR FAMILY 5.4-like [Herrania umbratica]
MDSLVAPVTTQNGRTKSPRGGWNAAIFIIFVEMAERFAFYGLAGNLITYLTNNLGQPIATAVENVNTWGMVLLSLSVSVIPTHSREAVFFTALYVLAIGEGGHKPCVQAFAADQFDENNPEEKAAKSSFFNWWYLGIVTGSSLAIVAVVYLQDNVSWTAGFGVLAGSLAVAFALFLIGIKRYRKQSPAGSPFTRVAQVLFAAAKKWRVSETHGGRGICLDDQSSDCYACGQTRGRTLARTKQFRFLDKAMIIDNVDAMSMTKNPWRLCSLNQVEEVKLVLCLIPIWLSGLMFFVVVAQLQTFFVKQGSTMIRSMGSNFQVPAAAMQCIVGLTVLIAVPIYDRVFVPIAQKISGHRTGITMLQRIGIGLLVSILNMVVAGLIETKRINTAKNYGLVDSPKIVVPMSIWWLLPQYVLIGIGDVFTIVGLQELFYDQMPEGMRSLGAAVFVSIVGVASFINNAIIAILQKITSRNEHVWLGNNFNRAHLNYFYWVLAGLNAVNFCVYLWIANRFVYKRIGSDETRDETELENGGYSN